MPRTLWSLAVGFLLVAGQTYAGDRPFRETARVTLPGEWRTPVELVGDEDVATTQIWISQDGNVGLGSSWSTGEAPGAWGATDIVLVDGVASQVSMTSGLDQSAIAIDRINVTDNFTGDLGLPGSPLQFITSGIITMRGSGTLHYTGSTIYLFVDSPNHLNAVSIAGVSSIAAIYAKEGRVDVGANAGFSLDLVTFGPYATVAVAGSANTAPQRVHCWDGTIDLGLRGVAVAVDQPTIEVGGGLLKLHKLTGGTNYFYLRQTGGVIDFDIKEANGAGIHMQLIGGMADFRKCQYVFSSLGTQSYIAPGMQIIPGPATTEAILTASGIKDFRKEYP